MEACAKQEIQNKNVENRLLDKNLRRVQRVQPAASAKQEESTEGEEMNQQQRVNITKDLTKKIRSKGRMDAEYRW